MNMQARAELESQLELQRAKRGQREVLHNGIVVGMMMRMTSQRVAMMRSRRRGVMWWRVC
jgi:hypothetical protein